MFPAFQQINMIGSDFAFREKQGNTERGGKMKNLNIFIAVLIMVLFGIGLIPAWSIDPQKLPPNAIIDKTKPGKFNTSPPGCVPTTCEQVGADRGNISDGCGKVLDCGIAKQVSATVDPPQYTGPYPKTLNFTGTITTKKRGKPIISGRWPIKSTRCIIRVIRVGLLYLMLPVQNKSSLNAWFLLIILPITDI